MSIILEHVTVSYGRGAKRFDAARNVSIAVAEGEAYGLVGESGSGKSTVLRAVAGLIPHAEGRVALAGETVGRTRTAAQRKMVQMVFQDPYGSLHPRHTVNTTLTEPLAIHGIGDADERINRVLTEVGLGPTFRYRYPHQLSGGQRQRLAIARALILEPQVLLLDEPTSALDVSVQAEILNLLGDLRERLGLTCILVSHDLAVIAHMCDRLGVMNAGKLLEELPVEALENDTPTHPYTRQLLSASLGYDRRLAPGAVEDIDS